MVIPHVINGRNKLFFFGDYKGIGRRQGSVFTNSVPTEMERGSGYTDLTELITTQAGNATSSDVLWTNVPVRHCFCPPRRVRWCVGRRTL